MDNPLTKNKIMKNPLNDELIYLDNGLTSSLKNEFKSKVKEDERDAKSQREWYTNLVEELYWQLEGAIGTGMILVDPFYSPTAV